MSRIRKIVSGYDMSDGFIKPDSEPDSESEDEVERKVRPRIDRESDPHTSDDSDSPDDSDSSNNSEESDSSDDEVAFPFDHAPVDDVELFLMDNGGEEMLAEQPIGQYMLIYRNIRAAAVRDANGSIEVKWEYGPLFIAHSHVNIQYNNLVPDAKMHRNKLKYGKNEGEKYLTHKELLAYMKCDNIKPGNLRRVWQVMAENKTFDEFLPLAQQTGGYGRIQMTLVYPGEPEFECINGVPVGYE